MKPIPRASAPDSTLALLREGYGFIHDRCERLQSPVFATRLLLQRTLCMRGEEAARLFYDTDRFSRAHALPRMMQSTLVGKGGVQGLDGAAHRVRKALFMSLMTAEQVRALVQGFEAQWLAALPRWAEMAEVDVFVAVQTLLCRTVCDWAGVPLPERDVERRRAQLASLIDGAGGVGLRHFRARAARRATERWIADLVEAVRSGRLSVAPDRALARVSLHRDDDGELMPSRIAAVELLNLLRPTVAVAHFILFAALNLERFGQWRTRLATDDHARELFAQEVRRLHSFFPFATARVREDFEWRGYRFERGTRVMLDLFGTNRDRARWDDPDAFRPERFEQWDGSPYDFIAQGGGDPHQGHRCPGERLAIDLMTCALRLLTTRMRYSVPNPSPEVDLRRMPMLPKRRWVIAEVEPL